MNRQIVAKELLRMAEEIMVNGQKVLKENGYTYEFEDDNGRFYVKVLKGERQLKYYMFRDSTRRDRYVKETMEKVADSIKSKEQAKTQRKKERSEMVNPYVEGDILYSSWGYEQTNIDFYKVVKVLDKSIYLVKVRSKDVGNDRVVPTGNGQGTPKRRVVDSFGGVKINSVEYASKWDGKPLYETPANMGH